MPFAFFSFFLISLLLYAEEPTSMTAPAIHELGNGRYKIGVVSVDENTREITFPASVNLAEGLLEYAIVHDNGKIHESLLTTQASPLHLNIALKLLNFSPSPELFPVLRPNSAQTQESPKVSEIQKTKARLQIMVSWTAEHESKQASLNDWVYHLTLEKTMSPAPWIYQGSYLYKSTFQAESTGDIAAIFISRTALINFSGEDNDLDEPWIVHPHNVPPQGTKVTVTFSPLLQE